MKECLTQGKVPMESVAFGLRDPLEFLRDVEIDAPLASKFMARMIAEWMTTTPIGKPLSFSLFLQAPEYFKTDGRPAEFLKQILTCYKNNNAKDADSNDNNNDIITDEHVNVVSQLMTDEERTTHADIRGWLESP